MTYNGVIDVVTKPRSEQNTTFSFSFVLNLTDENNRNSVVGQSINVATINLFRVISVAFFVAGEQEEGENDF